MTGSDDASIVEDPSDSNRATVTMPGSGTLIIVSADIGQGDCTETVFVTLRRDLPLACVPLPETYALIVTDEGGNIVPEGSCVPSSPAIVTAPDHADPELGWTVDGTQVLADASRSITVPLSAGSDAVVVASVGRDDCQTDFTRTLTLCDEECTPLPDSYALIVTDANGNLVQPDECVSTSRATVMAPDHADAQISWTVDGEAATPAADSPRSLGVTVEADAGTVVAAHVGRDDCRRSFSRELKRCQEPPPPPPPTINWCAVALIILLIIAVASAVVLGIAFCLLGWVPEGITTLVIAIVAVVAAIVLFLALIGLMIWLVLCGSCRSRSSCYLLDVLLTALLILSGLTWIATVIGAVVAALGPGKLCWLGWLLDALSFSTMYVITLWWARFVGCLPYPRWVPDSWRFTIPDIFRTVCRAINSP